MATLTVIWAAFHSFVCLTWNVICGQLQFVFRTRTDQLLTESRIRSKLDRSMEILIRNCSTFSTKFHQNQTENNIAAIIARLSLHNDAIRMTNCLSIDPRHCHRLLNSVFALQNRFRRAEYARKSERTVLVELTNRICVRCVNSILSFAQTPNAYTHLPILLPIRQSNIKKNKRK